MPSLFSMMLSHTGHLEDAGEARHCQPYVLVTGINLRRAQPNVGVFLYGPWKTAKPRYTTDIVPLIWRERFWQLDMVAAPIAKPDDVIFLLALMEHADRDPSAARVLIKNATFRALDESADMSRELRIARLIGGINRAVDFANGGPNFSSAVEIRLSPEDITHLNADGARTFVRSFSGYGGDYRLRFELIKAESDFRNVLSQRDEALACAAE